MLCAPKTLLVAALTLRLLPSSALPANDGPQWCALCRRIVVARSATQS